MRPSLVQAGQHAQGRSHARRNIGPNGLTTNTKFEFSPAISPQKTHSAHEALACSLILCSQHHVIVNQMVFEHDTENLPHGMGYRKIITIKTADYRI
jgi:hypothetical protein